jgi:hypothetical protein
MGMIQDGNVFAVKIKAIEWCLKTKQQQLNELQKKPIYHNTILGVLIEAFHTVKYNIICIDRLGW